MTARLSAAVSIALLLPAPAAAELDLSDYQVPRAVRSERERRALQQEFERQREREVERVRQLQEEQRVAREAEQARLRALPRPVRLTRERCTGCHAESRYAGVRHSLPGWLATTARMRWLNGAPLTLGEMAEISAHLAEARPADTPAATAEWGAVAGVVAAIGWLAHRIPFTLNRRRRTP